MNKCYAWLDSDGVVRGELRVDESEAENLSADLPIVFIGTNVNVVANMINTKRWNAETSTMEEWEPPVRVISKFQFLKRFAPEKRVALLTLAKTDPMVEMFKVMLDASEEVDLDEPETVQGVAYLVSQDVITEDEQTVILG